MWLQIATIPASSFKFPTLWSLLMVTHRIGDTSCLTFAYFMSEFSLDIQIHLLGALLLSAPSFLQLPVRLHFLINMTNCLPKQSLDTGTFGTLKHPTSAFKF